MPCPYCAALTTTEMRRRTTLGYRMFHCRACRRTCNERCAGRLAHPLAQRVCWLVRSSARSEAPRPPHRGSLSTTRRGPVSRGGVHSFQGRMSEPASTRESTEPRDLPSQRICPARTGAAVRLSVGGRAAPPLLRRGRATRVLGVSWAHRTRASLALCSRPAPPPRLFRRRRDSARCWQVGDHRARRRAGKGRLCGRHLGLSCPAPCLRTNSAAQARMSAAASTGRLPTPSIAVEQLPIDPAALR